MSKSEKIGNQKPKTYIHFRAMSSAHCCAEFVCLGGNITKNVLTSSEINTINEQCFGSTTCAFVKFTDIQVKEIYHCRKIF
jgi:hypothetical protein